MSTITEAQVRTALSTVEDPEVRRPITEIGMVKSIAISESNDVAVEVYLTIAACPMKNTIVERTEDAVKGIEGVGAGGVHPSTFPMAAGVSTRGVQSASTRRR